MKQRLTDTAIRQLKATDKAVSRSDGGGLSIFVSVTGGRYWRLAYRFNGKQKTLSIGEYPTVTLREAREKRDKARRLLYEGIDPGEQKKADKAADIAEQKKAENTFEAVAREWLPTRVKKVSPGQLERIKKYLEQNIFPVFGQTQVGDIRGYDILSIIQLVEGKGHHVTAEKILSACSQVFQHAVITGRIPQNPAIGLRKAMVGGETENLAAVTDPKEIGELLRRIDGVDCSYTVSYYLKVLPYVFTRPSELRLAEWHEFDFDERLWSIPAGRMKMRREFVVPLSSQVISMLQELKRYTGETGYVFPSSQMKKSVISDSGARNALHRTGFDKEKASLHGFRATASTRLNEMGKFRSDVIEACLAHKDTNSVRIPYNRAEYMPERRQLMQFWADYLDGLKHGD